MNRIHGPLPFCTGLAILFWVTPFVFGHPVAKENHDRTIVVRLQKGESPHHFRVRVEYRLEVDEFTVTFRDMMIFRDDVNPADYGGAALKYYAEFTKFYAPIYADHLIAQVNGKRIPEFRCVSRSQRLEDDDGKALGHLRCDFVFESTLEASPDAKIHFQFHDQTYLPVGILPEPGTLVLSFVNETGLGIDSIMAPNDALRKRALENPEPGDDDRQRKLDVVLAPGASSTTAPAPQAAAPLASPEPSDNHDDSYSLLRLILHGEYGFWLTMLMALLFGAAHALTPGHGKTLVAAYLVGERGTVWHATFLGLITTMTHTGVVLILAIVMTLLPHDMQKTFQVWIQNGLGLAMGLLVAGMGFWLLLQRLAGRADHIHVGGGHHHHHHETALPASSPVTRSVGWWGLVVLGVTGGLVPCWDAVVLLFYTVGTSRFWLVLPAVLAFSAGLAAVLVLIGILVVQVPRFAEARFGDGRLLRSLPIASAIFVMAMGLWLCYEGVHAR